MKKLLLVACIAITGCTSIGKPIAVGKDTYYLAVTGGSVVPIAQMTTSAIESANDFCLKQGKKMMMDHTQPGYKSSEIYFLCVNDDQYQPVHTRSEANVRIETNR